jgi:UDP-3-O-[3-hydroxymyristoyl] glucosamine N-acyltransferase
VSGEGARRTLTASSIAAAVRGTLVGDESTEVSAVAPLDRALPHHVSFLASAKYSSLLASSQAGIVLVSPELADTPGAVRARIVVPNPHDAMLSLLSSLYPPPVHRAGVHATAIIGRGVELGAGAGIGPYVVIGDGARIGAGSVLHSHATIGTGVTIGERCQLFESVTLYPGAMLGADVRLHAGVRIGSDGFGYVFRNGTHEKIPHVGRCIIEDGVEIGANTTVDRGSIDDTVIGAGTRIDNLVQIAHNVRVGRLCLIMSQVGIAGSVHIEDGCILAGQVGISGHLTVGKGARLAAQAGVFGSIPAGETWSGYPARPHREALRAQAAMFRLPSIMRALERLVRGSGSSEPS